LGFPCNQFAAEEPGSESQIKAFVSIPPVTPSLLLPPLTLSLLLSLLQVTSKYGVTFPMFSKVEVNGPGAHPIYQFLKSSDAFGGGEISWNFQKFLVDREGHVVKTFLPKVEPEDLEDDIVSLLNK